MLSCNSSLSQQTSLCDSPLSQQMLPIETKVHFGNKYVQIGALCNVKNEWTIGASMCRNCPRCNLSLVLEEYNIDIQVLSSDTFARPRVVHLWMCRKCHHWLQEYIELKYKYILWIITHLMGELNKDCMRYIIRAFIDCY